MSHLYCGANADLPKGKQRGNMQDCTKKGQIRYCGVYKADPKTINAGKNIDITPSSIGDLQIKFAGLRGTLNRNKSRYETLTTNSFMTTDEKKEIERKRDEYFKLWKKAEKDIKPVTKKLKEALQKEKTLKENVIHREIKKNKSKKIKEKKNKSKPTKKKEMKVTKKKVTKKKKTKK
jgi:hypothetical protein